MTQDELVDLGKLIAAIRELQTTVGRFELRLQDGDRVLLSHTRSNQHLATEVMRLNALVKRLPCMNQLGKKDDEDTAPDCPAVLPDAPPSHRAQQTTLRDCDEDEPDSALLRQMDVRASKSGIEVKGPSVMVFAFWVVAGAVFAAWLWLRKKATGS